MSLFKLPTKSFKGQQPPLYHKLIHLFRLVDLFPLLLLLNLALQELFEVALLVQSRLLLLLLDLILPVDVCLEDQRPLVFVLLGLELIDPRSRVGLRTHNRQRVIPGGRVLRRGEDFASNLARSIPWVACLKPPYLMQLSA